MAKLFRLTGTYVGFDELKKAYEKLPQPAAVVAEEIQEKFTAVNMAAKLDTCNLHFLIQEMVKIYRASKNAKEFESHTEDFLLLAPQIASSLESIGIEISDDSWGFKGESPEPLRINAKLVLV